MKSGKAVKSSGTMVSNPRFEKVLEAFKKNQNVAHGESKGFGSGALKVNRKIFAMMSSKGKFVVRLPKKRVDELVSSGQGERFDSGRGRLMKEWFVAESAKANWIKLAHEAYQFVRGLE